MSRLIDLTGQPFGRLTVLERAENKNGRVYWKCECACGNITNIQADRLVAGTTQSCGCLNKERVKQSNSTHGMSNTPEFHTWEGIIKRCTNPKAIGFKRYAGRGITICDEWRHDFMAFYNHVGKKPTSKHTIERINNNLGYKPGNIKWATRQEQANNTRRNHNITLHSWTMNVTQWAKFIGVKQGTISERINHYNWPPAKAIFQPVKHRSK